MKTIYYTDAEYPGAWPNGTRVAKCGTKPGDDHGDGAAAVVVGSVGAAATLWGYFVEWADRPGLPVFVAPHRLRRQT